MTATCTLLRYRRSSGAPKLKRRLLCHVAEIEVGRQHNQFVANADLGEQRVDGSSLNAVAATLVAQRGCVNVVVTHGRNHGERLKPFDDPRLVSRPPKALQQLLQNDSGRVNRFATTERLPQALHLGPFGCRIPPQGQRPNARVRKQRHPRLRSRL